MSAGNPSLCSWILARIRSEGPMPFARFMEAALYHPEHGYYCRAGATTGRAGDFYTSADVHPAFGRLLARQIAEIADRTDPGAAGPFEVIEAGPGSGRMARDIIEGLHSERPDLARRTVYTLVEISASLRAAQREALAAGGCGERVADVVWSSWQDLLGRPTGSGFRGCVVANEFLDAMPVHRVEMRGGSLLEVHVDSADDGFREVLLPPSTPRLARHFAAIQERDGVVLSEGQRAEAGLAALEWVSSLGRLFGEDGAGGGILVDYGHPAPELYDASRRHGTLMCYSGHRTEEDPYLNVGEQDMTAHVDFSSTAGAAREAGLDTAPLATQMRFLVSLGLARMVADLGARSAQLGVEGARERLALHGLMTPGGMGEVFKVLLLARGTSAADLTGARNPFMEWKPREAESCTG